MVEKRLEENWNVFLESGVKNLWILNCLEQYFVSLPKRQLMVASKRGSFSS